MSFILEIWYQHCTVILDIKNKTCFKESKKVAVEKNLIVTIILYKKLCPPPVIEITRNHKFYTLPYSIVFSQVRSRTRFFSFQSIYVKKSQEIKHTYFKNNLYVRFLRTTKYYMFYDLYVMVSNLIIVCKYNLQCSRLPKIQTAARSVWNFFIFSNSKVYFFKYIVFFQIYSQDQGVDFF